MSETKLEDIFDDICKSLLKWKDHPKNGIGRHEKDLMRFQRMWTWLIDFIRKIENSSEEIQEYERDFVN